MNARPIKEIKESVSVLKKWLETLLAHHKVVIKNKDDFYEVIDDFISEVQKLRIENEALKQQLKIPHLALIITAENNQLDLGQYPCHIEYKDKNTVKIKVKKGMTFIYE